MHRSMHIIIYIFFVQASFHPTKMKFELYLIDCIQHKFHLTNPGVLYLGLFTPVLYRILAQCSFTDDKSICFVRPRTFLTLISSSFTDRKPPKYPSVHPANPDLSAGGNGGKLLIFLTLLIYLLWWRENVLLDSKKIILCNAIS